MHPFSLLLSSGANHHKPLPNSKAAKAKADFDKMSKPEPKMNVISNKPAKRIAQRFATDNFKT